MLLSKYKTLYCVMILSKYKTSYCVMILSKYKTSYCVVILFEYKTLYCVLILSKFTKAASKLYAQYLDYEHMIHHFTQTGRKSFFVNSIIYNTVSHNLYPFILPQYTASTGFVSEKNQALSIEVIKSLEKIYIRSDSKQIVIQYYINTMH